jgi:hypothetical protein
MFEQFVGIDWSGAKAPTKSYAVTLATCKNDDSAPSAILEKLSRHDVFLWISKQIRTNKKTLVGIDCNLGYAAHVAHAQLGESADYRMLWDSIELACADHDNFFAGNWWQNETYSQHFWQFGKQPEWFDLQRLRRITEHCAVKQGIGIPESPFKLIGAKQVGKGGLAGMRVMHALKTQFGDQVAIWPFEAELVDNATVVISENFPRLFIRKAGFGNAKVRSLDDLNAVLSFYQSAPYTTNAELNDHLTDAIIASAGMRWVYNNEQPLDINDMPAAARQIEGWIFGVVPTKTSPAN